MMWRGVRNWPFWPAVAIFAEHVLVHVALGVAVAHVELVELVDDLGEQRRPRDLEARVAHVARVGRAFAVECRG